MSFKEALDKEIDGNLKINSKFAKSFEIRKRREEIHTAKMRAQELAIYSESENSSEESEDSSAELLTKKADSKFMKVLSMIKKGDPKLKDPNFQAFKDSDFETSSNSSEKESKPVRYKELVTANRITAPDDFPKKETHISQQKQIKSDFLNAVQDWEQNVQDEVILTSRKVTKAIKEDEDDNILEGNSAMNSDEINALKEYWTKPSNNDDLFLKKFMLKKL